MKFLNRLDAGRQLANKLRSYSGHDTVVVALPRGGVVLGAEIAKELEAPLGLVLVKKIGHPINPEFAIGAVAEDEQPIYNQVEANTIDEYWLRGAEARAHDFIAQRRELYYDSDFIPPPVQKKDIILVDDGMATGLTMEAAAKSLRARHAQKIIVAVPVASPESVDALEDIVDEVITLEEPYTFHGAVGNHYLEFEQVDDEEVRTLLREVEHTHPVLN